VDTTVKAIRIENFGIRELHDILAETLMREQRAKTNLARALCFRHDNRAAALMP